MNKKRIYLIIIINSLMLLNGYALSDESHWHYQSNIKEKPMRAELILKIGSDKENEDFFKPKSFAIDREGRIFILDSGNSRIQCFSPEGKYLFTFGKLGQGPGEITNKTTNIKILEDGNIYVIDNNGFKINVYNIKGQFMFMGKIFDRYDDIVLSNKKYYLSNILLRENHIPIHISNILGEIDKSIGVLVEPSIGIISEVHKLKYPQGLERYFNFERWTSLLVNSKKEIIYSQRLPYRIIKYDSEGRIKKDTFGNIDFDTQNRYKLYNGANLMGIDPVPPVPYVFSPKLNGDDGLMVPFINPEKDFLYIDKYDQDINLISRYKAPIQIVNSKKRDYIEQVLIDNDNNLYCLVNFEENPAQLFKYKLIFE